MPPPSMLDAEGCSDDLAARLGHAFADQSLLDTAFRHRSWCVEHPGHESNERLEFLGDAVLGMVVAAELYLRHPDLPEGPLTEARKSVVSSAALAPVAAELGLGDALQLGRGEERTGGREKASLLENAFEAVVGAVYLDGGLPAAQAFVLRHLSDAIERGADGPEHDHKSRLQEMAARRSFPPPHYDVDADGPDHAKVFTATVSVDGVHRGQGTGRSKKQAEQHAAREALAAFDPPTDDEARGPERDRDA